MNVTYDPHTDTLSIVLAPRAVGLEILDASKTMPDPASVNLKIAG